MLITKGPFFQSRVMGRRFNLLSWFQSLFLLLCLSLLPIRICSAGFESLEENEAIQRFRQYLQIPTVQPDPDYAPAVEFLQGQADEIGLDSYTVEFVEKKPILIMTWNGSSPDLASILLNSHMDVVPVMREMWVYDPFGAMMDEAGNIYARGTQDMKGMAMHYLEAIRCLKLDGFQPLRTIHVVFVPDEEVGGADGWGKFIESAEFASLNVGIALDEGPIQTDHSSYPVTWAEKSPWGLVIKAVGATGHGSLMYDGSASENLFKSIESIKCFRDSQLNLVKAGRSLGDVVSINGVFLKAGLPMSTGFTMNVQPAEAEAGFDIRVPPSADVESALERRIAEEWAPASRNLTFWFEQKFETENGQPAVTTTGNSNPWWVLLENSTRKFGEELSPEVFHASTDMRYLRNKGIAAFGFTTIQDAPKLLHDHNEFVNGWAWLHGLTVFQVVLKAYASFPEMPSLTPGMGSF